MASLSVSLRYAALAATTVGGVREYRLEFDGRLRALGVSSPERYPALPDIPTIAESGVPGYDASAWQGLFGPRQLPAALVARLHKEVADIAKLPEIGKRLSNEGLLPQGTSPAEFEKFIAKEIAKWAKVTKAAGITAQ